MLEGSSGDSMVERATDASRQSPMMRGVGGLLTLDRDLRTRSTIFTVAREPNTSTASEYRGKGHVDCILARIDRVLSLSFLDRHMTERKPHIDPRP